MCRTILVNTFEGASTIFQPNVFRFEGMGQLRQLLRATWLRRRRAGRIDHFDLIFHFNLALYFLFLSWEAREGGYN